MYELVDERLSWFKMLNFPSKGGVEIPSIRNIFYIKFSDSCQKCFESWIHMDTNKFKNFNFCSIWRISLFLIHNTFNLSFFLAFLPLLFKDWSYGERLLLDVELPRLSLSIMPWFVIGSMNINFILIFKSN